MRFALIAAALMLVAAAARAEHPAQPEFYSTQITVSVNSNYVRTDYLQRGSAPAGGVKTAGQTGDVTWLVDCPRGLSLAYLAEIVQPVDVNLQAISEEECMEHRYSQLWSVDEDAVSLGEDDCGEERCEGWMSADEGEVWVLTSSGRPWYHMRIESGDVVEHETKMWSLGKKFIRKDLWQIPDIIPTQCPVMSDEGERFGNFYAEVLMGGMGSLFWGDYMTDYTTGRVVLDAEQVDESKMWALYDTSVGLWTKWDDDVCEFVDIGEIADEFPGCIPFFEVEDPVRFVAIEECPPPVYGRTCSSWSDPSSGDPQPMYYQLADRPSPQQQIGVASLTKDGMAYFLTPKDASSVTEEVFEVLPECEDEPSLGTPSPPTAPDVFAMTVESVDSEGGAPVTTFVQYDRLAHRGANAAIAELDESGAVVRAVLESCHRQAKAEWYPADGTCTVWYASEEDCGQHGWDELWNVRENSYYVGKHSCQGGSVCRKWRLVDADLVMEWTFTDEGRPVKHSVWASSGGITSHLEWTTVTWSQDRADFDTSLWTGPVECKSLARCPEFGDDGALMSEWAWEWVFDGEVGLKGAYRTNFEEELFVIATDDDSPASYWERYNRAAGEVQWFSSDDEQEGCAESTMDLRCPPMFLPVDGVGFSKVKQCPNLEEGRMCAFWTGEVEAQGELSVTWTIADRGDKRMHAVVYQEVPNSSGGLTVNSLVPVVGVTPSAEDFEVIEECQKE